MSKDYYQMNNLRKVLASNPKISNLLNLVRMILEKFKNSPQDNFINSSELKFLSDQM